MSTDNSDTQDDCGYDDWSDGQRAIDGQAARGQASFDAPAPADDESPSESIDEYNAGGLAEDRREDVSEDEDAEQAGLGEF